ncbi:MAG: preprotein translocase subunit SecE [Gemmatimonadales bacterium]|nr:preprotein translocase subunit SecE [Gemmatimonadales bacterium]
MAKTKVARGGAAASQESALVRAADFLSAVRVELGKVSWPTREQLTEATKKILLLSLALGVFIGLLDWVLQKILVDGIAAIAR